MLPPRYPKRASWTADEDALLRQGIAASEPLSAISARLDRTLASVERRMTRLALRRGIKQADEG